MLSSQIRYNIVVVVDYCPSAYHDAYIVQYMYGCLDRPALCVSHGITDYSTTGPAHVAVPVSRIFYYLSSHLY